MTASLHPPVAYQREHIAARIRVLLASSRVSEPDAARELGVGGDELHASLDDLAPFPTLAVLEAVVSHFGVDPTYLITGQYNPETHSIALEGGRDAARIVLRRLMSDAADPSTALALRWRATPGPPDLEA